MTKTPKPCFHSYSCWNSPQRCVPGVFGKVSIKNLIAMPVFGVWSLVTLQSNHSFSRNLVGKAFSNKDYMYHKYLSCHPQSTLAYERPERWIHFEASVSYTGPCNSAGHGTLSAWPKGKLKAPITLQVCFTLEDNEMAHRRLYFKQSTIPQSSLKLSSTCVSLHT